MTHSTTRPPRRGRKLSIRAAIGIALIAVWSAALLTGILLYVAPEGRRSGQADLLFGLSKTTWGQIHWWISLVAVALTVVHLIVDWKTFRACVRHLTHTHGQAPAPCN
jgi:hypothetical protein